jgi:hypothetical protein
MSSSSNNPNINFFPTIDESKIPPEVAIHLRLIYDRLANHYKAISDLNTKVTTSTTTTTA